VGLGVAVAGLALLRPALLAPLNRLANRFALLMQSIVNPVVMGVIFYGVITPLGILKRRVGQDLVRRGFDAAATSYWIERRPPGPRPETMNRQF
jgi:di/tricarboxylate transporter